MYFSQFVCPRDRYKWMSDVPIVYLQLTILVLLMILYNITVNIEHDVEEEWKVWMRNVHIPDVMSTGYFASFKFFKLLVDEPQGTTYSIQYFAESMEKFQAYESAHASRLQQLHAEKFGMKAMAFRSLLEAVD